MVTQRFLHFITKRTIFRIFGTARARKSVPRPTTGISPRSGQASPQDPDRNLPKSVRRMRKTEIRAREAGNTSRYFLVVCRRLLLRGTIVNRTYVRCTQKTFIYFSIFTNNIWPYLQWSPVIIEARSGLTHSCIRPGARCPNRFRFPARQGSLCSTHGTRDVRRQHLRDERCQETALSPLNSFRTPVPFWGQGSQIPINLSQLPPKRDCSPNRVNNQELCLGVPCLTPNY